MDKVLTHASYIKLLSGKSTKKIKKYLLESGSKDQIEAVIEIIGNFLVGNIHTSPNSIRVLKPKKKLLIKLWKKKISISSKQRLLANNLTTLLQLFEGVKEFLDHI